MEILQIKHPLPAPQIGNPSVEYIATLRDQFAMAALTGFLAQPDDRTYTESKAGGKSFDEWCDDIATNDAKYCYRLADAMMAERGRK